MEAWPFRLEGSVSLVQGRFAFGALGHPTAFPKLREMLARRVVAGISSSGLLLWTWAHPESEQPSHQGSIRSSTADPAPERPLDGTWWGLGIRFKTNMQNQKQRLDDLDIRFVCNERLRASLRDPKILHL